MNIMENDNKDYKIGLVIMASGLGKRFGGNKLMEPLNNKPLIKWGIEATEGLFDRRIVVTRSNSVYDLCKSLNLECILHEFPGRNDTVRLGLNELSKEMDFCFFMPGDQPLISRNSIEKLISSACEKRDKIIRTGYKGNVGSPMGFPSFFYDELMALPEGKGGNYIAKSNSQYIHIVDVQHEYELWDVDTLEDLEKLKTVLTI